MIYYKDMADPTGDMVEDMADLPKCDMVVGHNKMFALLQSIMADRMWKLFRFQPPLSDPSLLPIFDIQPNNTINDNEQARLDATAAKVAHLRSRVELPGVVCAYVPLRVFYATVPHEVIQTIFGKSGMPPKICNVLKQGFLANVTIKIHKGLPPKIPNGGYVPDWKPPKLVGPINFSRGLRPQCCLTPVLSWPC